MYQVNMSLGFTHPYLHVLLNLDLCVSRYLDGLRLKKSICDFFCPTLNFSMNIMLEYMALNERGVNCLRQVFEIFLKFNKKICVNLEQK